MGKNKFITKEEISAVLFLSSEDESEDFNFNAEKSYTVKLILINIIVHMRMLLSRK